LTSANNGTDDGVGSGSKDVGKVSTSGNMRAMLEAQHGGSSKTSKIKAPAEKHAPKSKGLSKHIVTRSLDPGGGEVLLSSEAESERPPNPMLAGIQAARPPNPMLAGIQAARPPPGPARPPPGPPRIQAARPPPGPPKPPGAEAEAEVKAPARPNMGGMFAELNKRRID
jgi:hypothetical protein